MRDKLLAYNPFCVEAPLLNAERAQFYVLPSLPTECVDKLQMLQTL